jgi:hypothetical protein
MKIGGLRKLCIVFSIIVILLLSNSLVVAQSQKEILKKSLFNLQFVLTISWSGSDLQQPISPGETRAVNLTITSCVTRGAYGKILLRILEGGTYIMHLSVEDTPEWCIAWTLQENFTGVIDSNEITCHNTLIYIHLSDDAPGNYSLGWVKIRSTINDKKGPFNIITLIHGFEQNATLTFITGP